MGYFAADGCTVFKCPIPVKKAEERLAFLPPKAATSFNIARMKGHIRLAQEELEELELMELDIFDSSRLSHRRMSAPEVNPRRLFVCLKFATLASTR